MWRAMQSGVIPECFYHMRMGVKGERSVNEMTAIARAGPPLRLRKNSLS